MSSFEKGFLFAIWAGFFLLLFTPLVVAKDFFFPFITGKNFYFRILVELMFGAYLALAILQPKYRPKKSPVFYALSIFVVILILATVFGVDPYHSFWSNYERMEGLVTHLHLFALFLILAHTIRGEKQWFIFLNVSLGVSLITAIHGYWQSTGALETLGGGRPAANLGNSIYLAVYLMFHLFLAGILALRVKNLWASIFYVAAFIFEFYVFFLASSRGAFIGFGVGIVLVGLLFLLLSKNKMFRLAGIIPIILTLFVASIIVFDPDNRFVRGTDLFDRFTAVRLDTISEDPRVLIWGIALRAAQERPLLGWGPENFVVPYAKFYDPNLFGNEPWFDRAHNMLLEWLVAAGFPGLISYLALFAVAVFLVWKMTRGHHMPQVVAIILIGLFVAYIVQNIFVFDNLLTYIIVFSLLAYIHSEYLAWRKEHHTLSDRQREVAPLAYTGAAIALVASLGVAYVANAKPMMVARQIIIGLQSIQQANVDQMIREFDPAINAGTFGTTEARERVADMAVQIAFNIADTNEAYMALLNYAIRQMEEEIQESRSPRISLFLGKLYTIRTNLTGEGAGDAEATYKKLEEAAPNYVQTYLGFAELYLITGEEEKAVVAAEKAYSLPTKHATRGALFYPILSVHMLAGSFDNAQELIRTYRDVTGNPLINPIINSDQYELLVTRSKRSNINEARVQFYEELMKYIIEDYGFPEPFVLAEMVQTYQLLGNDRRANELTHLYSNSSLKEKGRLAAQAMLSADTKQNVDRYLNALEALP